MGRALFAVLLLSALTACAAGEDVPFGRDGSASFDAPAPRDGVVTASCATCGASELSACHEVIPLDLAAGSLALSAHVEGTTEGRDDAYAASCGGGSGPDAMYRLTPSVSGWATARLTASFAGVLAVRTACEDGASELGCDVGSRERATELSFPVMAGETVHLLVDGYAATRGAYALDVTVAPSVCGDGVAGSPEECDDGNVAGGDGCSASCKLEAAPAICGASGYRLVPDGAPARVSFAGDTATRANALSPIACSRPGAGPDVAYALTAGAAGSLALTLTGGFDDAVLHVRRACQDATSQVDCVAAPTTSAPAITRFPVEAEETVYVVVDGATSSSRGHYRLDATLTAARCGNGLLDPGEECDRELPGCTAACTVSRDPASYACPGADVRLEGAARTRTIVGITTPAAGATVPASSWSWCGSSAPDVVYRVTSDVDGLLRASVKGSFDAALAIRATCAGEGSDLVCARVNAGLAGESGRAPIARDTPLYVVVDGASSGQGGAFELDVTVTPAVCGNGVLEGGESCDDGAVEDGDGCSASCALESERARDTCGDGAPLVTLAPATDGVLRATLRSGTTNLTKPDGVVHTLAPCASTGPDAWFRVEAPNDGVLTARIASASFGTVVALRRSCEASSQITCDATAGLGGQVVRAPVRAGDVLYVGVSGAAVSGASVLGRFVMDLELAPTTCGDGYTTGSEACDDGNAAANDGCSATCALEALPAAATCPGHDLLLTGTGNGVREGGVTVTTSGLPSETGGACGGSGPEAVLRIVPDVSGILQARAVADFAAILHARTSCADPASELLRTSCAGLSTFTRAVTKGVPLYLYVDGLNGAAGVAQIRIQVSP